MAKLVRGGARKNFDLRQGGLVENFSPSEQDLRPPPQDVNNGTSLTYHEYDNAVLRHWPEFNSGGGDLWGALFTTDKDDQ